MRKLKGQELRNLISKIDEIISSENIDHYKNLKYDLSKFRRVHVNSSYVILFFDEKEKIYFVDYAHHDVIYKPSKKTLEKYEKVKF
ncbi:addiction module toxin RelE [Candidatus Woesearchaeota archaeon]|nr:addiction module toxin RelE [Candidatus Woesearchaeota archaeon]USN43802.1 MAG: addiction module toxin RelE [Candidatus Woesearchaeota archaeon]